MQFQNKMTHEDFKSMKKQLKLTNASIASEIGLTADSVKSIRNYEKQTSQQGWKNRPKHKR